MSVQRSVGAFIARLALCALLLLFVAPTGADPDLWGHVKFGGDIAAQGLHSTDPYSFASDRPWINHEWLAEVVMFQSWALGGGPGLIGAKTLLSLFALAFVLAAIGRVQMSPTVRILVIFTAVAGMWPRTYVFRPQMFSLVLFAAMLWILISAERGRTRRLWMLPIIFALWVNLHGGWIVGLGALGLWTFVNLTLAKSANLPQQQVIATSIAAVAATLLNPYGPGMWSFIFETVRFERHLIADWQPLVSSGPGKIMTWGTASILTGTAFLQRRCRIPLSHALLVIALGIASLKVSRLDAFFAISVTMLLAPQIAAFLERPATTSAVSFRLARWLAPALIGASLAIALRPQRFTCVTLDGPWMPEREAANWIEGNGLRGRLLTWFGWGQYAIWHFEPAVQVSFDGRRETVYSEDYIRQHTDLYFNPDRHQEFLNELGADYAWLPVDLPLAIALQSDGWKPIFSGPESVVLSRSMKETTTPSIVRTPGCFPGP